jgi:hypothetical protein
MDKDRKMFLQTLIYGTATFHKYSYLNGQKSSERGKVITYCELMRIRRLQGAVITTLTENIAIYKNDGALGILLSIIALLIPFRRRVVSCLRCNLNPSTIYIFIIFYSLLYSQTF